jgi:RNA polymerase sigma-70 factor (ECF subfamily)
LYKILENIPEVQRSALILKDIEGYSYKEIADILKLSIQQVEVYIFRARVALKKNAIKNNLV